MLQIIEKKSTPLLLTLFVTQLGQQSNHLRLPISFIHERIVFRDMHIH